MMSESAVLCESDKMLNENHYTGTVLDLEFGSGNLEGDVSNPSFSTDVSDEEDFSSGDEDDMENGKKRKHDEDIPKTKDQLDRRRERNRVLARKTRLRKKSFFEALQKQVAQLAVENDMLKGIVRQRLGGSRTVCTMQNAPLGSAEVALSTSRANAILENADHSLMSAIQAAQRSYVISDPTMPDNPIIFASKGFLDLSGYTLENTLGRNCRFLQGPGTDLAQVKVLSDGIRAGVDTSVCLLNYRADGTPFFNQIFIAAIRDKSNVITNYVGVQVEMKSLLDPNSSIDIEDLGLNKVPKKGRPRTRELKEPKPPRIKEPKEQKAKSSHTKAQLQKASQKLLSAASSCSSSTTSEKRHASESRVRDDKTLSSIILDIPSLGINSPLRTGTPVPEYIQDESNFENMASLSGLRSFAAYTSAAPAQHILACHGEQGQGVKSGSFSSQSDTGSGEMTSATSMHDLHGLGRSPNSTCTGTGTCTPASEPGNDGTLGGLIQTNHSIDSLQIIDDLFFMFDRSDSVEGDYSFQFMGDAPIARQDSVVMGDSDISANMGDEGWNF